MRHDPFGDLAVRDDRTCLKKEKFSRELTWPWQWMEAYHCRCFL